MRFWDSSAIVPLLVNEASSPRMVGLYREDTTVLVWMFTSTEVTSALCRRHREGALDLAELQESEERLGRLREDWVEAQDLEPVRQRAERLLHVHPLTAADSLQLAAALVATEERPQRFPFVTLDERLGDAAQREGFRVEGIPSPHRR